MDRPNWLRKNHRALYLFSMWSVALTLPWGILLFFGPRSWAVPSLFLAEFFLFSPGGGFAVAHGQMGEGELEAVMMDYLRGGADVLVCTSIIELGIDIPQANTLMVERADTFGLAQLYQIRGRVGRSRERAYAYLLYDSSPPRSPPRRRSGCRSRKRLEIFA